MKNITNTLSRRPVTYRDVMHTIEHNPERIQDKLFLYDVTRLANYVKRKLQDTRDTREIMQMIAEEMLDGKWEYKNYLRNMYAPKLAQSSTLSLKA